MIKNKFNKFFISCTLLLALVLGNVGSIFATGFNVTSSRGQVAPGQQFSVTVSGAVVGRFDISVSNGSVNQSVVFINDIGGSASVVVTAGSRGNVVVNVYATDVADQSYTKVEGSRSISVPIVQPVKPQPAPSKPQPTPSKPTTPQPSRPTQNQSKPTTSQPNTNQTEETKKSNNALLSALSIKDATLSPAFNANTKEYKTVVKAGVESIKIEATAQDKKAKITGDGEVKVKEGDNKIEVKVSAEDGTVNVYTIHVKVEQKPVASFDYANEKIDVVQAETNLDALFTPTKIKIDGKDVQAFVNKALNMTIVSGVNNKTKAKGYYIYDVKNNKIISSIKKITFDGRNFYACEPNKEQQTKRGLTYTKVKLADQEVFGWTFNDDSFKNYELIYTLNEEGKEVIYQLDKKEKDLQVYSNAAPLSFKKYDQELAKAQDHTKTYQITTITASVIAVLAIAYAVISRKKHN